MLAIDTSGVESFAAWLDKEAVALREGVRNLYHQWAIAIHAEITELTPQWSGNLAANWALDVGSISYSPSYFVGPAGDVPFSHGRGGGPLYARGMDPAVGVSLARAKASREPMLSESFYIHNPVEYAQAVEDDSGDRPIRAVNRLPRTESGKVAMVAHAYFKHTLNGQALIDELRSRTS